MVPCLLFCSENTAIAACDHPMLNPLLTIADSWYELEVV
jgi:hypothetical protein